MDDTQSRCKQLIITCEAVFEHGTILGLVKPYEDSDYTHICIDLRWVEFLHSPFLGEIIRAYTRLLKNNIQLQLSHLAPINQSIIKQTNLDQLINIIA